MSPSTQLVGGEYGIHEIVGLWCCCVAREGNVELRLSEREWDRGSEGVLCVVDQEQWVIQ